MPRKWRVITGGMLKCKSADGRIFIGTKDRVGAPSFAPRKEREPRMNAQSGFVRGNRNCVGIIVPGFYYFGIHVKDLGSTLCASHFLQSNFIQTVRVPSIRLSDMRSISISVSKLHTFLRPLA